MEQSSKDFVANMDYNGTSESDDSFYAQVSEPFSEWLRIPRMNYDNASANYVLELHETVLSKPDNRFFHNLLEFLINIVTSALSSYTLKQLEDPLCFLVLELYIEFVFWIYEFYPFEVDSKRLSILSEVLEVIVRFIRKDAQEKKAAFNPRIYDRLFVKFFAHMDSVESKGAKLKILIDLSNSFHGLLPEKVPEFRFAWVDLVGHKDFLPKLLTEKGQIGWAHFHRLLINILQYFEPLLRTGVEPEETVCIFHPESSPSLRRHLRMLLVLFKDFPEFLCYYHHSLCDVISPRCFEMRNIVLSAFPPNTRLPDPRNPNLQVDLLDDTSRPPWICSTFDAALGNNRIKIDVDEYLMKRPAESLFLTQLKKKLCIPSSNKATTSVTQYNVPLLNSLVLYVGTKAIEQLLPSTTNPKDLHSVRSTDFLAGAHLDIFQKLIQDLDSDGRYLFFSAVANQLRYPNSHTYYFSILMLHLFTEIEQEEIKELIATVLLERLIVKPPHPWGALFTFLELGKNHRYNLWNLKFTKSELKFKRVFEAFSGHCGI